MNNKWKITETYDDSVCWVREEQDVRLIVIDSPYDVIWQIRSIRSRVLLTEEYANDPITAKKAADAWLSTMRPVVPIAFDYLDARQQEWLREYNRLHQELFNMLVKVSGVSPDLLQPKAHMAKHAELLEGYFDTQALDNRSVK